MITIKQLADMAKITVRTLQFYDKIGLLKPVRYGVNGRRYYTEVQLLILEQIVFFKELGFELKKIKVILEKKDIDTIVDLISRREILEKTAKKNKELSKVIEERIEKLKNSR